ncbi:MAG: MBOAT family protein [Lachnospiraceae bacterium]|nr:MBOAT family protein [Lachnospiraceae bacterium]
MEHPLDIAVPLGISFFTFMQIAYLVDCYRTEKGFDYSFLEYATYVAFFPKITMGPIALHDEIIPQFRDDSKKIINYNNLSGGLYAFALGLAKKVLIADTLAKIVNACYAEVYYLNTMTSIVVMVCYTLQIYFDFSGYCDMAAGAARMINIELPLNFNSPYKAKSISEFWERWHMTLTRFFTRYVYIPLGGSRKGKLRTYINTMIVFLISGLWHGADVGFIIWGFWHGVIMVIEKVGKDLGLSIKNLTGIPRKILDILRWLATFVILNITWMYFRAGSSHFVGAYFGRLPTGGWEVQHYVMDVVNELIEIRILKRFGLTSILEYSMNATVWVIILLLIAAVVFMKNTQEKEKLEKYNWKRGILTVVLLVWSIVSLSDVSEFLYFDF